MERPACAGCVRILHKHGVLLNQKAWWMPTVSENWAGQPLVDIETVVNLISNTTTRTGLKVRCDIDNNVYLKGTKITDEEFDQIALDPISEFGTWNYIIRGFKHDED